MQDDRDYGENANYDDDVFDTRHINISAQNYDDSQNVYDTANIHLNNNSKLYFDDEYNEYNQNYQMLYGIYERVSTNTNVV